MRRSGAIGTRPSPVGRRGRTGLRGFLGLALAGAMFASAGPPAAMAESVGEGGDTLARDGQSDRLVERWREATSAERREMRTRLRERWEEASPTARRRMARRMKALERALPDFSPIERLILMRATAELPRAERRALRGRIRRIDDLPPDERAALVAELEETIHGFDTEVERLERNRDRWKSMSESERDEYRAQMRRLRAMSAEERRALFEEMERRRTREGRRGPTR